MKAMRARANFKVRNVFLDLMQNKITDVMINGSMEQRIAGNISLTIRNVSNDILINNLGDIVISKGSACNSMKNNNSHVLKAMGSLMSNRFECANKYRKIYSRI